MFDPIKRRDVAKVPVNFCRYPTARKSSSLPDYSIAALIPEAAGYVSSRASRTPFCSVA